MIQFRFVMNGYVLGGFFFGTGKGCKKKKLKKISLDHPVTISFDWMPINWSGSEQKVLGTKEESIIIPT